MRNLLTRLHCRLSHRARVRARLARYCTVTALAVTVLIAAMPTSASEHMGETPPPGYGIDLCATALFDMQTSQQVYTRSQMRAALHALGCAWRGGRMPRYHARTLGTVWVARVHTPTACDALLAVWQPGSTLYTPRWKVQLTLEFAEHTIGCDLDIGGVYMPVADGGCMHAAYSMALASVRRGTALSPRILHAISDRTRALGCSYYEDGTYSPLQVIRG